MKPKIKNNTGDVSYDLYELMKQFNKDELKRLKKLKSKEKLRKNLRNKERTFLTTFKK